MPISVTKLFFCKHFLQHNMCMRKSKKKKKKPKNQKTALDKETPF